jgi:hypothetical protein
MSQKYLYNKQFEYLDSASTYPADFFYRWYKDVQGRGRLSQEIAPPPKESSEVIRNYQFWYGELKKIKDTHFSTHSHYGNSSIFINHLHIHYLRLFTSSSRNEHEKPIQISLQYSPYRVTFHALQLCQRNFLWKTWPWRWCTVTTGKKIHFLPIIMSCWSIITIQNTSVQPENFQIWCNFSSSTTFLAEAPLKKVGMRVMYGHDWSKSTFFTHYKELLTYHYYSKHLGSTWKWSDVM